MTDGYEANEMQEHAVQRRCATLHGGQAVQRCIAIAYLRAMMTTATTVNLQILDGYWTIIRSVRCVSVCFLFVARSTLSYRCFDLVVDHPWTFMDPHVHPSSSVQIRQQPVQIRPSSPCSSVRPFLHSYTQTWVRAETSNFPKLCQNHTHFNSLLTPSTIQSFANSPNTS